MRDLTYHYLPEDDLGEATEKDKEKSELETEKDMEEAAETMQ